LPLDAEGGLPQVAAAVGACKVTGCIHNNHLMCGASEVAVGHEGNEVDCLSFAEA
jgi:hypothetical protein